MSEKKMYWIVTDRPGYKEAKCSNCDHVVRRPMGSCPRCGLTNDAERCIYYTKYTYSRSVPRRCYMEPKYKVVAYLKSNRRPEFDARNIGNAREMAHKIITEGLWIKNDDGGEEYFPITELNKVRIIPN